MINGLKSIIFNEILIIIPLNLMCHPYSLPPFLNQCLSSYGPVHLNFDLLLEASWWLLDPETQPKLLKFRFNYCILFRISLPNEVFHSFEDRQRLSCLSFTCQQI
jgi:hypothetical protein